MKTLTYPWRFLTARGPPVYRLKLQYWPCLRCGQCPLRQTRYAHTPADDPYFQSIVDNPPVLVKSGQQHGKGLIILSEQGLTLF